MVDSLKGGGLILMGTEPMDHQVQVCLCDCVLADIATVIASYQATGPEQLSLQPGQLIDVRKKNPSGWWEGELQVGVSLQFIIIIIILFQQ